MIFTSYTYVAFLLLVFALYWSVPALARKPLLVVASYLFYCWWDWRFGPLLLGVSLFNWSYGRWVLARAPGRGRLALGIVVNLAPLLYFKYSGFLLENVAAVLRLVGHPINPLVVSIALPLGVSFFTFQGIAYLIDVASGDPPFERPLEFLLYKAFWPQLIAGPIIRPGEIKTQIEEPRSLTYDDVATGARRILAGFVKKVVVADMLSEYVDLAFLPGATPGFVDAIIGTVGFSLQIYFDFSAYSDIAIGSARLFGFKFPENFDWPYLARSPQEFWERWHMTLSRWIRDYVFTPLAFAQRGRPKMQKLALVSAMAICGLWHGARWTFVLWGVWHGLLLVANQTVLKAFFSRSAEKTGQGRPFRTWLTTGVTVSLVAAGWILFRAQDVKQAGMMLSALATGRGGLRPMLVRENGVLIVLVIVLAIVGGHIIKRAAPKQLESIRRSFWARFLIPVVQAAAIVAIVIFDKEAKAFVYFQF